MNGIRVRFAPSPTGLLHIGGARTALFNWLFARANGGTMILRIEDTDDARNTAEANEAIFAGLRWLGLDWDEGPSVGGPRGPYRQSERQSIYDAYLQKLTSAGLVYDQDGAQRFRSPNTTRTIPDLICGETVFADRAEPDMTIRRANGSYIFHFVNVVDDIEMGVTHVIRGEDHLSNTPRHLDLYEAFGVKPPQFAHIPLILNADGSKMSKRDRGASVQEYIREGFHPEAVVNYIALLGWSPPDAKEILTRQELRERFRLEDVNRANARFDLAKCQWLSGQHIAHMAAAELRTAVAPFLQTQSLPTDEVQVPDALLLELREKLRQFSDAPAWLSFLFHDDFARDEDTMQKLRSRDGAASLLTALRAQFAGLASWSGEAAVEAIGAAAKALNTGKGSLMFPCRVALSGQPGGVGLVTILDRLGKDRTLARLDQTIQLLGT